MRQITKAKDKTQLVADKLGISNTKVNAVVDFYYSLIKKELIDHDETFVYLPKIGTFIGHAKKTAGYIKSMKNLLSKLEEANDFETLVERDKIKKRIIKKTDYLEKILKEYDEKKRIKKDLAEQNKHLAGDKE